MKKVKGIEGRKGDRIGKIYGLIKESKEGQNVAKKMEEKGSAQKI